MHRTVVIFPALHAVKRGQLDPRHGRNILSSTNQCFNVHPFIFPEPCVLERISFFVRYHAKLCSKFVPCQTSIRCCCIQKPCGPMLYDSPVPTFADMLVQLTDQPQFNAFPRLQSTPCGHRLSGLLVHTTATTDRIQIPLASKTVPPHSNQTIGSSHQGP